MNESNNILINKGKVFVNVEGTMKETTNVNFIGCALLDALDDNSELELNI